MFRVTFNILEHPQNKLAPIKFFGKPETLKHPNNSTHTHTATHSQS